MITGNAMYADLIPAFRSRTCARNIDVRDAHAKFLLMRNLVIEQIPGASLYIMKKRHLQDDNDRAGAPPEGLAQKVNQLVLSADAIEEIDYRFASLQLIPVGGVDILNTVSGPFHN